ncbi:hypothetical protein Tco_0309111 [Tanacetum coccineum]
MPGFFALRSQLTPPIVNGSSCDEIDMVIKKFGLRAKGRCHDEGLFGSFAVLPGGKMSNNLVGGNIAEACGSASGQAEHAVGQDGLGGSDVGVVIGLSVNDGQGGAGERVFGVGSQRFHPY